MSPTQKAISIATLTCFLITSTTYGILSAPVAEQFVSDQSLTAEEILHLAIPDQYGSVRERFLGNPNQTVIAVQDSHANYEAQLNFAHLMDFLGQGKLRNAVQCIVLEGGQGPIDISHFREYPDKEAARWVSDVLVKQGFMNGAEYFGAFAQAPVELWGAETLNLYVEDLSYFIRAHKISAVAKKSAKEMRELLQLFRGDIYSPELRALVVKQESYDSGALQLTDFAAYLDEACRQSGIVTGPYENFQRVLKVMQLEKQISMQALGVEQKNLVEVLQKASVREELSELVKQSLQFRLGKISAGKFYGYLKDAATHAKLPLGPYPNVIRYAELTQIYDSIDATKVFWEVDQIVEELKEKWLRTPDERLLEGLFKNLSMLERMLQLKMTREDLTYYKEHKEEITGGKIVLGIKELLGRVPEPVAINPIWNQASEPLAAAEAFYDIALQRDGVLLDNLLRKMQAQKAKVSVVFTGGFHTEGITRQLKAKNISYVVWTPRITQAASDSLYLSVMLDRAGPMQRLLSAIGTRLSPPVLGAVEAIVARVEGDSINTKVQAEERIRISDALYAIATAVKAGQPAEAQVEAGGKLVLLRGGRNLRQPLYVLGDEKNSIGVEIAGVESLPLAASRLAGTDPIDEPEYPLNAIPDIGKARFDPKDMVAEAQLQEALRDLVGRSFGLIESLSGRYLDGDVEITYRLKGQMQPRTKMIRLYKATREQLRKNNAVILLGIKPDQRPGAIAIAEDILGHPDELVGNLLHDISELMGLPHSFGVVAGGEGALRSSVRYAREQADKALLETYGHPWKPDLTRAGQYRQELVAALGLDLGQESQLNEAAQFLVQIDRERNRLASRLSAMAAEKPGDLERIRQAATVLASAGDEDARDAARGTLIAFLKGDRIFLSADAVQKSIAEGGLNLRDPEHVLLKTLLERKITRQGRAGTPATVPKRLRPGPGAAAVSKNVSPVPTFFLHKWIIPLLTGGGIFLGAKAALAINYQGLQSRFSPYLDQAVQLTKDWIRDYPDAPQIMGMVFAGTAAAAIFIRHRNEIAEIVTDVLSSINWRGLAWTFAATTAFFALPYVGTLGRFTQAGLAVFTLFSVIYYSQSLFYVQVAERGPLAATGRGRGIRKAAPPQAQPVSQKPVTASSQAPAIDPVSNILVWLHLSRIDSPAEKRLVGELVEALFRQWDALHKESLDKPSSIEARMHVQEGVQEIKTEIWNLVRRNPKLAGYLIGPRGPLRGMIESHRQKFMGLAQAQGARGRWQEQLARTLAVLEKRLKEYAKAAQTPSLVLLELDDIALKSYVTDMQEFFNRQKQKYGRADPARLLEEQAKLNTLLARAKREMPRQELAALLKDILQRHDRKEFPLENEIAELLSYHTARLNPVSSRALKGAIAEEGQAVQEEETDATAQGLAAFELALSKPGSAVQKFHDAVPIMLEMSGQNPATARVLIDRMDVFLRDHGDHMQEFDKAWKDMHLGVEEPILLAEMLQSRIDRYLEMEKKSFDQLDAEIEAILELAGQTVETEQQDHALTPPDYALHYESLRRYLDYALKIFVAKGRQESRSAGQRLLEIGRSIPERVKDRVGLGRIFDRYSEEWTRWENALHAPVHRAGVLNEQTTQALLLYLLDRSKPLFGPLQGENMRHLIEADPMVMLDYLLDSHADRVPEIFSSIAEPETGWKDNLDLRSLVPLVLQRAEKRSLRFDLGHQEGKTDLILALIPALQKMGYQSQVSALSAGTRVQDVFKTPQALERVLKDIAENGDIFGALVQSQDNQAQTIDLDALVMVRDGEVFPLPQERIHPLSLKRLRQGNVVVFSSKISALHPQIQAIVSELAQNAPGITFHLADIPGGDQDAWQSFRLGLQEQISKKAGLKAGQLLPFRKITVLTTTENYLKYWREKANQCVFFLMGSGLKGEYTVTLTGQMIEALRVVVGEEEFKKLRTEMALDETTKIYFTPQTGGKIQEMFLQQQAMETQA